MLTCYIRHVYQTHGVDLIGSTEYVLVTMIDSIGRLQQVNNFLWIFHQYHRNQQAMERPAG